MSTVGSTLEFYRTARWNRQTITTMRRGGAPSGDPRQAHDSAALVRQEQRRVIGGEVEGCRLSVENRGGEELSRAKVPFLQRPGDSFLVPTMTRPSAVTAMVETAECAATKCRRWPSERPRDTNVTLAVAAPTGRRRSRVAAAMFHTATVPSQDAARTWVARTGHRERGYGTTGILQDGEALADFYAIDLDLGRQVAAPTGGLTHGEHSEHRSRPGGVGRAPTISAGYPPRARAALLVVGQKDPIASG